MFAFLNVLSNVAYLAPAYMLISRRMLGEATWFIIAAFVSSIYHMCRGGQVCIGISEDRWRLLDHNVAYIAVAQTVLVLTSYKLVYVGRTVSDVIRRVDESAQAFHPQMIFVETRFAHIARAVYIASIIAANVLFFDTIFAYAILLAVGFAITLANFSVVWRLDLHRRQGCYVWIAFALSLLSSLATAVLYFAPEDQYQFFHPAWHTTSATTAVYIIYGASQKARVFKSNQIFS